MGFISRLSKSQHQRYSENSFQTYIRHYTIRKPYRNQVKLIRDFCLLETRALPLLLLIPQRRGISMTRLLHLQVQSHGL
jgi:hypothetical protein